MGLIHYDLIRRDSRSPCTTGKATCVHSEKTAIYKPRREASPETNLRAP